MNELRGLPFRISHLSLNPSHGAKHKAAVSVAVNETLIYASPAIEPDTSGNYDWSSGAESLPDSRVYPGVYHISFVVNMHHESFIRKTVVTSRCLNVGFADLICGGLSCDVAYEDATLIGILNVQFTVVHVKTSDQELGLFRSTQIPVLEYLGSVLKCLPVIRPLSEAQDSQSYETLRAVAIALWASWRPDLPALVESKKSSLRGQDDALVRSIIAPQDNALEDMILQVNWQLSFWCERFGNAAGAEGDLHPPAISDLAMRLLEHAARGFALVFQWADNFSGATWEYFQTMTSRRALASKEHRDRCADTLRDLQDELCNLLRFAYDIRKASGHPTLVALQGSMGDALVVLYQHARTESFQRVNRGPYTGVFECILGPSVQSAFTWIESDFHNSGTVEERDALRRLLTRLAQRSGKLPNSLILHDIQYYTEHPGEHPQAIAKGGFADVYVGVQKETVGEKTADKVVAIKQLRVLHSDSALQKRIRQLYLEILTCRTLIHPNVLPIVGIPESQQSLAVVIPWMSNGHVHKYLNKVSATYGATPTWLINRWLNHIARGMEYLHQEGIAHGDLRGVNVLVDDDETARITDFGLAVYVNGHSQNYASMRTGNPQWLAPEILSPAGGKMTARPTPAADVYSFSHMCIELFTGDTPYRRPEQEGSDGEEQQEEFALGAFISAVAQLHNPLRPSRPPNMPDTLWDMLGRYWAADPAERPTAEQVVADMSILPQEKPL